MVGLGLGLWLNKTRLGVDWVKNNSFGMSLLFYCLLGTINILYFPMCCLFDFSNTVFHVISSKRSRNATERLRLCSASGKKK